MWWPWWPFNAADVYMGSLLPLERMLREGAVDDQVTLVPVLDGFRLPTFYHWWFAPFFKRKVSILPPHGNAVMEHLGTCSARKSLEAERSQTLCRVHEQLTTLHYVCVHCSLAKGYNWTARDELSTNMSKAPAATCR